MKISPLLLFVASSVAAGLASAQTFLGSDSFSDNTLSLNGNPGSQAAGYWANAVGGTWSETNQRLEWSGTGSGVGIWITPALSVTGVGAQGLPGGSPFQSSWSAQVSVTDNTALINSNPNYSNSLLGLSIYTSGVVSGNTVVTGYYSLFLENWGPVGRRARSELSLRDGTGSFVATNNYSADLGVSSLTLRFDFDATTKQLVASYRAASPTFIVAATWDLDGAAAPLVAPLNDGLGVRLYAYANSVIGTVPSGTMYFDNMSVTAVPEPSTFALLAGLGALGCVGWRRCRPRA